MIRPLLLSVAALPALASLAHGQLVLTEINSNGTPSDFWELTNFGASTVNLSGYKWNDSQSQPTATGTVTIPSGTQIAAGESILFSVTSSAADFRTAWNLPANIQVITGGPGLGQDDRVTLYNASNTQLFSFSYAAGGFTRSTGTPSLGGHAGPSAGGDNSAQSLILDPNHGHLTPRYTFASGANFGTRQANPPFTAIGSPGSVGTAGTNSPPLFTPPAILHWTAGLPLSGSSFRVRATDTDPGQTVTLNVVSKPSWLSFSYDGVGIFRLNGTPPAAEDYEFTIRATDNAPSPASTEQTYKLVIVPASSPVFLNEYNAVSATNYLRGGTAEADADGASPGPGDAHFGRIPGNGGPWAEFVVVGNGLANHHTDMRGWKIEIQSQSGNATLTLSQHSYWSAVRSGTILTFIQNNSANGGLDTSIHHRGDLHGTGHLWTNIWTGDPLFLSQSESSSTDTLPIGADNTTFTIRNAAGTRVYGPAGEGIAADSNQVAYGVSSTEILRVEAHPATNINPITSPHNDASTFSTFGAPNRWGSGGANQQSFSAFVSANSPPRFTSQPATRRIHGSFQYAVSTSDPNGHSVTLTAPALPSFLTLTPGPNGTATLATNRIPTLEDAGEHVVTLLASDGQSTAHSTPQSFLLHVFHTRPSLILNEFNAVAPTRYLNGGDALGDSDGGPASTDTHFGRIPGNGGRWFELVVTGDGSPSTVDLRGWSVEIGTSSQDGFFEKSNTITLSSHAEWSAVPAGTILTFIDANSAHGGLDTGVRLRDHLATTGDAWTNVWIGDPLLLNQPGPALSGYEIQGGRVENLRINQTNTQFRLKNAAGHIVFGPVGEGIAPLSGVSDLEIFELEDHPSPDTSPLAEAIGDLPGYDDGASGSTFGFPNEWHVGDGGVLILQDFRRYIAVTDPFAAWAASFGLAGTQATPEADPDNDGRYNLAEYAFGGNPALADAPPAAIVRHQPDGTDWSLSFRNDPTLLLQFEQSANLTAWSALETASGNPVIIDHPEKPGFLLLTLRLPAPTPPHKDAFVRAKVTR